MSPDLEFDEPFDVQRREWRFQAAGLVVLALVVVAALLGVFGHGMLSWSEETSASGELQVDTSRLVRRGGRASMTISADASLASGSVFRVVFDQGYVDAVGFERLEPTPETVMSSGDEIVYLITRGDDDTDLEMTIDFVPRGLWPVSGAVRVGDQSVSLDHFVYP